MKRLKGIAVIRFILLLIIKIYQYSLSPIFGLQCRFWPSCSAYSYEAIHRYGSIKGLSLAIKRILKCHPYHPGGYDPVP